MLSFKEYLLEAARTKDGNYVAINTTKPEFIDYYEPSTGKVSKEFHVTLMYSAASEVDPDAVKDNLVIPKIIKADVIKADIFDSQTDETVGCIVLKLKSKELEAAHKDLIKMGLVHSYPEYSPHLTLWYDVELSEARRIVDALNAAIAKWSVKLSGITSNVIIDNWNESVVPLTEMPKISHLQREDMDDVVFAMSSLFNGNSNLEKLHNHDEMLFGSFDDNGIKMFSGVKDNTHTQFLLWKRRDISSEELQKFVLFVIKDRKYIFTDNNQSTGAKSFWIRFIKTFKHLHYGVYENGKIKSTVTWDTIDKEASSIWSDINGIEKTIRVSI